MKRIIAVLLTMVLLLSLTACGPRKKTGTEEVYLEDAGVSVTINYDDETIRCGDDLYTYMVSRDYCTINYPNGATYWDYGMYHVPDEDYDPERYLPAELLLPLLAHQQAAMSRNKSGLDITAVLSFVLLLTLGLLAIISPESMAYLRGGWRFKNAEPTEWAITMERIAGIFFLIMALVLLGLLIFG